jgi:23S rRNA pseudouridine2605 synthase
MELVRGSTNAKIGAIGRMDKKLQVFVFTNDTDMIRKFTLQVKNHLKSIRFH